MKKRASFRHLTDRDRDRIQALRESGHTCREIAGVLRVSKSTISRELRRDPTRVGRYVADRAHKDAREQREGSKRPGMKVEAHPDLKRYIIRSLKRLRAPDEIAGRLRIHKVTPRVGKNAIYKWLYSEDGKSYSRYLCTKRSKKRRQHRLGAKVLIPDRISLRHRPRSTSLVHGEGDLFVSPRPSKACGVLVVANDTKLLAGSIIPRKTRAAVVPAMRSVVAHIACDDLTLDNGIENIHHRDFGVPAYFCDKGAPHQKPRIESSIGLVRRWFLPKGTDLSKISDTTFQAQLHLLNHKYRKSLGYRSAYEAALEHGIIDRVPRISLTEAVAFR